MDILSKDKMDAIKTAKKITNKDIAHKTGLPISTIDKIFSGINNNPTLTTLKKIAKALDCSIDDFIEYDTEPTSPYYLDRQTGKIAQEMLDNPELKVLFDASKRLKPEDIKVVTEIVNRLANRE